MKRPVNKITTLALAWLALSLAACGGPSDLDRYEDAIQPVYDQWRATIKDWEVAANNPDKLAFLDLEAASASLRMQAAITSWAAIDVPPQAQDFHLLMRQAMSYEQQAFENMNRYYRLGLIDQPKSSDEFQQLRRETIELWNKKDEALKLAIEAYPRKSGKVILIGGP